MDEKKPYARTLKKKPQAIRSLFSGETKLTKSQKHQIAFGSQSNHAPIEVMSGTCLSEALDTENSPILFGCRTGICGTCIIKVNPNTIQSELYPTKSEEEFEIIDLFSQDQQNLRLACQIHIKSDLDIEAAEGLDA